MTPAAPSKRGARSLRGAMGTYLWVSAAAVLVLGLVLWFGPDWKPETTRVTLDARWQGALLEDGQRSWEFRAGEAWLLPPGSYRLTLFSSSGDALRREVVVRGETTELGATDG